MYGLEGGENHTVCPEIKGISFAKMNLSTWQQPVGRYQTRFAVDRCFWTCESSDSFSGDDELFLERFPA